MTTKRAALLVVLALACASCGGGGGGSPASPPPPPPPVAPPPPPPPVNLAPEFRTSQTSLQNFPENTASSLDVAVSDPEGSALTLTLSGADATLFTLNSGAKRVTFNKQPNFERPADANADNRYEITLTATDGVHTTAKNFTLQVTNLPEALDDDGAVMIRVMWGSQSFSARSLGDLDADGNAEMAFGSHRSSVGAGDTYVVPGFTLATLQPRINEIDAITSRITIRASQQNATAGGKLAVGDIDGDKHLDLFINEPFFYTGPFTPNYRTITLRGSDLPARFGTTIALNASPAQIQSAILSGRNSSLAVVADIDGDSIPEVAVSDQNLNTWRGVVNVVPGSAVRRTFGSGVSLFTDSAYSVRISGPYDNSFFGMKMAPLNDFDGDGFGDLLISAPGTSGPAQGYSNVYLVSSSAIRTAARLPIPVINLAAASLPAGVVRFTSPQYKFLEVASIGDINGDGKVDILISGRNEGGYPFVQSDAVAWIFFSGTALPHQVNLDSPGDTASAITIRTHDKVGFAGYHALGVGDIDQDGKPDLLATDLLAGGSANPGAAYLIFGSALQSPGTVRLDNLQATGSAVLIKGAHRIQNIDSPEGASADINGDGYPDVVISGRKLNDNDVDEFFILSGKMLVSEKTKDRLVELGVLFPEIVEP
ncbi:MAG: hypothetical protein EON61_01400 [Alphaproteobacteria bacterium]|jgi:hypothetical protein|nr:MAG: hypothetical protein EON61_01400 [Alphaproteobacteria bacterium]